MKTPTFTMRPDTCDPLVVQEVWFSDCYGFKDRKDMEGKTVVDIGANIGTFTVMAALKECEVMSFEPEPNNFALLEANCLHNSVSPVLRHLGVGIGTSARFSDNNGGTRKGTEGTVVQITSINKALANLEVDFLKMDCEGSEYEIFMDATHDTLSRIREFAIEFHPDLTDPITHQEVMAKLSKQFNIRITGGVPRGAGGIVYGERKI
jgi:FkbM family methyltransferase